MVNIDNKLISLGVLTGRDTTTADSLPTRTDSLVVINNRDTVIITDPATGNETARNRGGDPVFMYRYFSDINIENISYYLHDHLGNTRVVYTPVKDPLIDCPNPNPFFYRLEYAADYYPYGKILREFQNGLGAEKYLTTHHERDTETGLDYRGARYYDADVARFLSLDPYAKKYIQWSPYNYVFSNPALVKDEEGKENTIYLIALESSNSNFTKEDVQAIADKANQVFIDNGVETRVVVYTASNFTPANLDETDSYAILGTAEAIKEYVSGKQFEGQKVQDRASYLLDKTNPEESSVNGKGILLASDRIENAANTLNSDKNTTAAYLLNHGAGHNATVGYHGSDPLSIEDISSEIGKNAVYPLLDNIKTLNDVTKGKNNPNYGKTISDKFGNKKSEDKYINNERRNNGLPPINEGQK